MSLYKLNESGEKILALTAFYFGLFTKLVLYPQQENSRKKKTQKKRKDWERIGNKKINARIERRRIWEDRYRKSECKEKWDEERVKEKDGKTSKIE